jgi:copper chaperone CopZ
MEGQTMTTRSYAVDGMTCGHCVTAVTAEVGKVAGVERVTVDLDGGTVAVTGKNVDDASVRDAVDAAGYSLAG